MFEIKFAISGPKNCPPGPGLRPLLNVRPNPAPENTKISLFSFLGGLCPNVLNVPGVQKRPFFVTLNRELGYDQNNVCL